ncbi:MAG: V-type ATPase 116kDa subunit family protein [Oscillospiraceae bacterium]
MSVEKMEMVSLIGDYKDLNKAICFCISSGCYQPESTAEIMSGVKGFAGINEENPYSGKLKKLSDVFSYCSITPTLIEGCDRLGDRDVDSFITELDKNLHDIQGRRIHLQEKISSFKTVLEQLEHFVNADINLAEVFACQFVKTRFGRLPTESYYKLKHYKDSTQNMFFPCSGDENYLWGMYVATLDNVKEADRIFASLFFERLILPDNAGSPKEAYEFYNEELKKSEGKLKHLDEVIENYFANHLDECMQLFSQVKYDYEAFDMRRFAAKYNDIFMLIGWVPAEKKEHFIEHFKSIDGIEIDFDTPENIKKFVPPTKMKNHRLFRPFQFFTEIYGVPSYKEIDPTAFIAITYTLLYGIMFADLGQGLVLSVIGFIMYRFMKMPLGKILIPCGISSAIFGSVFGSVFGNEELLNPMFHALGFAKKPFEVMQSATTLLAASVAIGVVLVIIAMFINVISSIKQKDLATAIFSHNGLCGIILYSSIVFTALNLVIKLNVNQTIITVCGILLPLVLIFLKEPLADLISGHKFQTDGIGNFIIENFFELFEVILSYLSNTLSFLRVGAFVLIHAGMMTTFVSLAEIAGGGVAGVIVMVFGNIFVIALEGLLVGIQVLRLEFYEMFSRFYNGDGKVFQPVKIKI